VISTGYPYYPDTLVIIWDTGDFVAFFEATCTIRCFNPKTNTWFDLPFNIYSNENGTAETNVGITATQTLPSGSFIRAATDENRDATAIFNCRWNDYYFT
jgi:hypothetical protein